MRRALLIAGLVLLAGGSVLGFGGPRLTLVNTGLRIQYPGTRALGLLGASVGLGLLAWAAPRAWMRWIAVVGAAATAAAGAGRALYRLDAAEEGIADRRLLGSTGVAWSEVRRVDAGADLILVWGPGDAQVRVETWGLTPDQRAMLDRTISRHVREAQEKAQQARPTRRP